MSVGAGENPTAPKLLPRKLGPIELFLPADVALILTSAFPMLTLSLPGMTGSKSPLSTDELGPPALSHGKRELFCDVINRSSSSNERSNPRFLPSGDGGRETRRACPGSYTNNISGTDIVGLVQHTSDEGRCEPPSYGSGNAHR